VLKRAGAAEEAAYTALMADKLREVVPAFHGRRSIAGTDYLEIQCCLAQFRDPCMMDVKMGTRTSLIPLEPSLHRARRDLFEKMVKQDPSAATPEEAAEGAVTKRRYLDWRDATSSSAGLGLRIEGTLVAGSSCHDYKATRTRDQVSRALQAFVRSRQTRVSRALKDLFSTSCAPGHLSQAAPDYPDPLPRIFILLLA
jgi:1D-myo-inositol-triphosphate 3-kinase